MRHGKSNAEIDWEADVDRERDRLIELGEPPWVATENAVKNVQRKRRERAVQAGTIGARDIVRCAAESSWLPDPPKAD